LPYLSLSVGFKDKDSSNYDILDNFFKTSSQEFIDLFFEKFEKLNITIFFAILERIK